MQVVVSLRAHSDILDIHSYLSERSPTAAGGSPVNVWERRLTYGHVCLNCDVIVSGGLGCSLTQLRLGVPPEIVLVTLGGAGTPVA